MVTFDELIQGWRSHHPDGSTKHSDLNSALDLLVGLLGYEWLTQAVSEAMRYTPGELKAHFLASALLAQHPVSETRILSIAKYLAEAASLPGFDEALAVFREDGDTAIVQFKMAFLARQAGAQVGLEPATDGGRKSDLILERDGISLVIEVWSPDELASISTPELVLLGNQVKGLFLTDATPPQPRYPDKYLGIEIQLHRVLASESRKTLFRLLKEQVPRTENARITLDTDDWSVVIAGGPSSLKTGLVVDQESKSLKSRGFNWADIIMTGPSDLDPWMNPHLEMAYTPIASIHAKLSPNESESKTPKELQKWILKKVSRKIAQTKCGESFRGLIMTLPSHVHLTGEMGGRMLNEIAEKAIPKHSHFGCLIFVNEPWANTSQGREIFIVYTDKRLPKLLKVLLDDVLKAAASSVI